MRIGVKPSTEPRTLMVKVPPRTSSGPREPALARSARSVVSLAISAMLFSSAPRTTGTTRPSRRETATPTFTSSNVSIWPSDMTELSAGYRFRAPAHALVRTWAMDSVTSLSDDASLRSRWASVTSNSMKNDSWAVSDRLERMWSAMDFRMPDSALELAGSGSPRGPVFAGAACCDSAKALTSPSVTLPRGPVGVTWEMSTSRLAARRRAPGVEGTPVSPRLPAFLAGARRAAALRASAAGALVSADGGASPSASR